MSDETNNVDNAAEANGAGGDEQTEPEAPQGGEKPPEQGKSLKAGDKPPKGGKKRTLIDHEVSAESRLNTIAKDAINRIEGAERRGPINLVVQGSRLADILAKQAKLPAVTAEEMDFSGFDPNAFPEEVLKLVEQEKYYFIWVKNPDDPHYGESDAEVGRLTLRAESGKGGIYEIATRSQVPELPGHLFNAQGVIARANQLLAFVPYDIWEKRREWERTAATRKMEHAIEGFDEEGEIPTVVSNVGLGMSHQSKPIPDQPGDGAPEWDQ
jgi:hypothetical protein